MPAQWAQARENRSGNEPLAPLTALGGRMDNTKHGLSGGVAQIVKRLFTDDTFKEDALANPELAFEGYSLEPEERAALKSLVGRKSGTAFSGPEIANFW